jgi:[lysine-biosynthesis-protein LysW]--L-2-aminoadipate ligase
MTGVAVLGSDANETNRELVRAWAALGIDAELVAPRDSARCPRFAAVLGRLDVLPTLDGVEAGLLRLLWLERRGVRVLNTARALLTTHDKLRSAAVLRRAGLPHPRTRHVVAFEGAHIAAPVVLKPRFGSWGRDVRLCRTAGEVAAAADEFGERSWFRRHGVLVQEPLPSPGFDLRLLVAGGRVVGGIERHAAPGEWRTNISVGGSRRAVTPPPAACRLALAATAAVGADLVGVDLLPTPRGYVIVELNGAVDFDADYRPDGDVHAELAEALGFTAKEETCPRNVGASRVASWRGAVTA